MAKRDDIRARIQAHGERRAAALATADAELDQVIALAPAALEAGLTVKELAELGGTSRPTLYARLGLKGGRDAARA